MLRLMLLVVSAVMATPLVAQERDLTRPLPVDSAVTTGVFDNGLRYFIRANTRPENRAELRLVVDAGSVLEDDDQRGLAHFVEHMAFNGTRHFPKQALVEYLERIGMRFGPDINAYTSFDETVYMLTVPTDTNEVFEQAFQILEDWAHQVSLDDAEVDLERGVVIEEWRLGRGAAARIRDKQFPVIFKDSRYAERLPIGSPDVLRTFDYPTIRRFYEDWYRPDLMAVVAVGDFDVTQVEELIRRHFAHIGARSNPRERTVFAVPDHDETLVTIATDAEATSSNVAVYYKQPLQEVGTVGAYRQGMVEGLHNSMLNARFFEITQQPDAPFLGAGSGRGRLVRSSEVALLGAGVRDGGAVEGLDGVLTEAARAARFGFTQSELDRARSNLLRGMELAHAEREKTPSARYAGEYVRAFLESEPIPGVAFEYELHQRFVPAVSLAEVNAVARAWLAERNRVILVDAPDKEGVTVPTEAELLAVFDLVDGKEIAPYEDAVADVPLLATVPAPSAIVSEEEIEEVGVIDWRLENGVRVLLKPTDFQDDQVVFRATSPGGTSLVDDTRYFAAATATAVVGQGGVGELSLVNLQKVLTGKAVRVQPTISQSAEGMSGAASPKDLTTMFQLIYLYFTAPRADEVAFEAFKQRMQASLANVGANPRSAFGDTVTVTMSQYHHRSRPLTAELLEEMDLDASLSFYRDRFADAGDFTFVFAGSFDVDSIRPLVQSYLGGLPSMGREETWRDPGVNPPRGVVRKTVRRGVEAQSQTRIVFTGEAPYSRATAHGLQSMTQVLQTWLRETLREELGGTYSVSVSGSASRIPKERYRIDIAFGSAPERAEELTSVVFHHIDSLQTTGPSSDDIVKVQEAQRRARETNLRQNSYWVGQLVGRVVEDTDLRQILSAGDLTEALDIATVREAARRLFDLNNFVYVVLLPEAARN
jgi:zinc protease